MIAVFKRDLGGTGAAAHGELGRHPVGVAFGSPDGPAHLGGTALGVSAREGPDLPHPRRALPYPSSLFAITTRWIWLVPS